MIPIYLHGSYANSNEELFERAWHYGVQGIETNAPGLHPADDVDRGMAKLASLKDRWLVQGVILHFPMDLITDNKWPSRQDVFSRMARSFRIASEKLGVKVFNTMAAGTLIPPGNAYTDYPRNGSAAANDTHWQRAAEMLTAACDLAADCGLTLVIETHGCLIHDLPGPTLRLLDLVSRANLKINVDLPNMVLSKANLLTAEELEPLVSRVGHVHLKNLRMVIGGGYLLEGVGGGIIDYKPLLRGLQAAGYSGVLSLEFPGRYGDMKQAIQADVAYVKNLQLDTFGCTS